AGLGVGARVQVVCGWVSERGGWGAPVPAVIGEWERGVDVFIRPVAVTRKPEAARDIDPTFRSRLKVSVRSQLLECLLEQVNARSVGGMSRAARLDEERDAGGIAFGPKLERRTVEPRSGGIGCESECALAGRP